MKHEKDDTGIKCLLLVLWRAQVRKASRPGILSLKLSCS